MTRKQGDSTRRKHGRSTDQRNWNIAIGRASSAWEYLTDQQRLLWNVAAKTWRSSGQRYFVKINARRLRDGLELLTEPPRSARYDSKPVLKRLLITNRRGRIVLKLEVSAMPGARYTVWGSRPCNLGVSWRPNCPRLGALPAPVGRWSDITALYFRKHGDHIMQHELPVVGKRIYIRVREERDAGPTLYRGSQGGRPGPGGRTGLAKKWLNPMEFIWNSYGIAMESLWCTKLAMPKQQASNTITPPQQWSGVAVTDQTQVTPTVIRRREHPKVRLFAGQRLLANTPRCVKLAPAGLTRRC